MNIIVMNPIVMNAIVMNPAATYVNSFTKEIF